MSPGQYALGLGVLAVLVGPLVVTAVSLRKRLLPAWSGTPARVAELVIGIVTLVVVSEALGTVGIFKRWPLVISCGVLAGVSMFAVSCRQRRPDAAPPTANREKLTNPPSGAMPTAVAILVVALVLDQWLQYALSALHTGMREFDTVTYHMPFAARFAQGSLTGLQYIGNPPVSFYPANSELVHGVGILVFRHDILSPVLNIGWLGFALLAGWCIGRPSGVGPATMAATALVASLQVMVSSQAGTAKNDIVALALLLASAALWSNAQRSRSALFLAAIAGGLAVGTRLNLWASVLALSAIAVAYTARGRRISTASWGAVGIAVGGGFWYARNLFAVGNPFPWFSFKVPGLPGLPSTSPPVDCGQTSVAHYLTDPGFIASHLFPQIAGSMGDRWWVVAGVAAVGVASGLAPSAAPTERALAIVALTSGVAYVLTPASAGGAHAACFAFNSRFAAPALALGLVVLPLSFGRRGIPPILAVVAILIAIVVDAHVPWAPAPAAGAAVLVIGVIAVARGVWRSLPRLAVATALVLIGLIAVVGSWREQRVYLRDRYTQALLEEPVEPIYAVLRHAVQPRVAVSGLVETYPLYGLDSSNVVDLPVARVGARFAPYTTCRGWLTALQRGRYDYVVTAQQGTDDSPATAWTRLYPGAQEVIAAPPGYERRGVPWRWQLFRLSHTGPFNTAVRCAQFVSRQRTPNWHATGTHVAKVEAPNRRGSV